MIIDDDLVPSRRADQPYKPEPKQQQHLESTVKGGSKGKGRRRQWWHSLEDDDPISLEPLKELDYAPFHLDAGGGMKHYFDGRVLAYFIVSTASFMDPLSRDPLSRSDCVRLDKYVA